MINDVKSLIIKEIDQLSEKIREIEDASKASGVNFLSDSHYIYLLGRRDSARYILRLIK